MSFTYQTVPYPYNGYANEIMSSNEGTIFDADDIYKREYTKTFRVRVLDKRVGAETVCRAPGIPAPYTPYFSAGNYEYDLSALVTNISAKKENEGDWQNWLVTVKYSTELRNTKSDFGYPSKKDGTANHPELEPPVLDWDFEVTKEALPLDLNSRPFINSAGDLYDPPPMVDIARPVLSLQRNQLNFNAVIAQQYAFALNSKMFLGQYPYTAQSYPPKATQKQLGGLIYWRVHYKIRFKSLVSVRTWSSTKRRYVPIDRKKDEQKFLDSITEGYGFFGNPYTRDPGKTWLVELLDAGYNEYPRNKQEMTQDQYNLYIENLGKLPSGPFPGMPGAPSARTKRPIINPQGGPLSKPALLDGDGAKLPIPKLLTDDALRPYYNQFWCYPEADLNILLQQGV